MKRVALELGGKSANVILDDADLDKAVKRRSGNVFLNAGQTCTALTRMLVPAEPAGRGRAIAAARPPQHYTVGDPIDAGHPARSAGRPSQRERVRGYIEQGIAEGATLVTGGPRPAGGPATSSARPSSPTSTAT